MKVFRISTDYITINYQLYDIKVLYWIVHDINFKFLLLYEVFEKKNLLLLILLNNLRFKPSVHLVVRWSLLKSQDDKFNPRSSASRLIRMTHSVPRI